MFKINYSILSIIIISIIIGLTSIGFLEYKKHMINYKKLENNMNKNKEQINKCSIILDNLLNNIKQKSKNKKNIEEENNSSIEKEEDVIVVEKEEDVIVVEKEEDVIVVEKEEDVIVVEKENNSSIEKIIEEVNSEMNNIKIIDSSSLTSSESDSNSSSSDSDDEEKDKKDLFDSYMKKGVKELREILKSKNLNISGNKTKLVNRILEN